MTHHASQDPTLLPLSQLKVLHTQGALTPADIVRLQTDARAGVKKLVQAFYKTQALQAQEQARLEVLTTHERQHWQRGVLHVAGVDEVGVGPLAGPVVAAAVILPPQARIEKIDDSKKLRAALREALAEKIMAEATCWAVGICSPREIDALNIYQASCEAMRRAVLGLQIAPEHVLVDARYIARIGCPQTALVHGDSRSHSIAAASIVAKVTRDKMMQALDKVHPGYGFAQHAGYGTPKHLQALFDLGPSAAHRRSFAPVRQAAGRHA